MALDKFRAAPLPNPPAEWDSQYMRQVIRVLETYFSQLDSRTPNNAEQYSADRFIGGLFLTSFEVLTTDGTPSPTSSLLLVDASSGLTTITLPPAAQSLGRTVTTKKTDASANHVVVEGDGAETIDGATSVAVMNQYDALSVFCDGIGWWII